jgi:hypothetical protein
MAADRDDLIGAHLTWTYRPGHYIFFMLAPG